MLYVSTNGSAEAAGTKEAPLKTIRAAVEKARPGDTITVLAGQYRGTVTLTKSGEKGKPITLKAEGNVVIDPRKDARDHGHGIVGRGVGYWVISGFEIHHHQQGVKFKDGHDVTVQDCRVHDGHSGVALEGASAKRMIFKNIEAYKNVAGGFDVSGSLAAEDIQFIGCKAHHNGCKGGSDGFGITHKATAKNVRFENCSSHDNGSDGFDLSGRKGFGVTVVACKAYNNGLKMWGSNFKCWNPGSVFINCVAWKTGKDNDPNFAALAPNISFINCTSGENGDAGFAVAAPNARIVNCIIAHSKKIAVRIKKKKDTSPSVRISNCLVHACGDAGPVKVGKDGNLTGDPKFVDVKTGDFRIRVGSAAAGKGEHHDSAAVDFAGKKRPKANPSIGAFEPQ